ncbi:hypothetical protein OH791_33560 [Streptomyces anulatus]|uniref:hypothetical protein n=1 Tax=Streptomyces anulatus TaxID=1892 RepID=UPI00386E46E3|nr:hypothetical protein OH791_33560 [Streptomyces anulatus]
MPNPTPADRPTDLLRAAVRAIHALKSPKPDGSRHYRSGWDDGLEAAMDAVRGMALAVARQLLGTTTTEGEPEIVAYRNTDRPGVLLCREHGAGWLGLTPLTSEDLEDGGFCTWGREYGHECGRDVLIAPTTPAASLGEVVSRLAAHAVGFQDVLDESDRGPWGALILADIAELRALANRPATDAAPPAPADRAALTETEQTMLNYALNQAQLRIWSGHGSHTEEDQAALVSLRRLADDAAAGVQPPTTSEANARTMLCSVANLGRIHHAHTWQAQPGMPPLLCPGRPDWSLTPPAAPAAPEEPTR